MLWNQKKTFTFTRILLQSEIFEKSKSEIIESISSRLNRLSRISTDNT